MHSVYHRGKEVDNNPFVAAFQVCKNAEDAEDVVQDTFIQYHTMKKEFDSSEHIRAWLISFHSI